MIRSTEAPVSAQGANPMTVTTDVSARLDETLARHVAAAGLPSMSVAVARHGEILWAGTAGEATPSSRYVIFSATKAIVAAAVWQLLGEGRVQLDQPVRDLVPEFGVDGRNPGRTGSVTLHHLLTHTGGFPDAHLAPTDWPSATTRRAAYARWESATEPGTSWAYHPASAHWVLADVIEAVDAEDFRASIHRRVTEPLGLPSVLGPDALAGDVRPPVTVGTEPTDDEWRAVGITPPSPPDPGIPTLVDIVELLSRPVARGFGVPGGGGVMTAADLALFYQGLLHNPGGLWDPRVLDRATREVVPGLIEPWLGFPVNRTIGLIVAGDDGFAPFRGFGNVQSPRSFGHDGAGGQIAFADPDAGLSIAVLTDGMDLHAIRQWKRCRSTIDVVFSALR
jgi:CubicO group peptidase (beta-lactamase class C family)